ncbi:MAG: single-stranded-DNA-specific exonuclease RecJ [Desulfobacterales bacterium]|nr:single-stranded-DNA-specific exonuclease RecJ [Desulfobacterales bacterium]
MASGLAIPPDIARLLLQRGIAGEDSARAFLGPTFAQLPPPRSLLGMNQGVAVIEQALSQKMPVTVYGDYDVDGITATALLVRFLRLLGLAVTPYQPDRLTEGYGLNQQAIRKLHARAMKQHGVAGVLVTVDCGITSIAEVTLARELGFLVVITDHHLPLPHLPPADALINPLQPGCPFPDKNLAGVGVAFYYCMGLRSHLVEQGFWPETKKIPNLKTFLDLVALGTIADVVSLTGVNRVFVRAGLEVINQKKGDAALGPGLNALFELANIGARGITVEDISFRISPRINAAGRVGSPETAIDLLLTEDPEQARSLARTLENTNQQRREIEAQVHEQALALAGEEVRQGRRGLVLWGQGWHPGVIGITAARLAEQFWRPCILFAVDGDLAKGSARSVPDVDLHQLLCACNQEHLVRFGGHAGAAGVQINTQHLEIFKKDFERQISIQVNPELLVPRLWIDAHLNFQELFVESFLSNYIKLFPFGRGNPEPVFVVKGCRLTDLQVVGPGQDHLRFVVRADNMSRQGIAFGFSDMAATLREKEVDLAFRLRLNEFRGRKRWELIAQDMVIETR